MHHFPIRDMAILSYREYLINVNAIFLHKIDTYHRLCYNAPVSSGRMYMSLYQTIALAVALAMDAFAVALCKGACLSELKDRGESVAVAVTFGFFQALMPLIGWFVGSRFRYLIESVDHFIAFGLLAAIGGKLIYEAWKNRHEELVCTPLHFLELMLLGIATSIDALAAGLALAVLDINIWLSILSIGVITTALSFTGFHLGKRFGTKLQSKAQLAGGLALIVIGTKILIEHLSA